MGSLQIISPPKVLIIGGSYGGLGCALNLLDLCAGRVSRFSSDRVVKGTAPVSIEIKVVDERDGLYHLIGSPLALASKTFTPKAWVKFSDLPALRAPNLSHLQGRVISVDSSRKVATISDINTGKTYEEKYDYLVAASGLRRAWPTVPQSLTRETYLKEALDHCEKVQNAQEGVVVIGGGAVGIEMAAELALIYPTQKATLIHSHAKLLSSEPLPDDFKDRTLSLLKEAGVNVLLNHRVTDTVPIETKDGSPLFELTLGSGEKMLAGHVIWAVSRSVPTTGYLANEVLDKDGYVKITPTLKFKAGPHPDHHFALGDIVSWSGIKRCGAAMFMGSVAATNIHQSLISTTPKYSEIEEIPPMIALAVGKEAVVYEPGEGTKWGKEQMKLMFGSDLGFTIVWNYLKLGEGYGEKVE